MMANRKYIIAKCDDCNGVVMAAMAPLETDGLRKAQSLVDLVNEGYTVKTHDARFPPRVVGCTCPDLQQVYENGANAQPVIA